MNCKKIVLLLLLLVFSLFIFADGVENTDSDLSEKQKTKESEIKQEPDTSKESEDIPEENDEEEDDGFYSIQNSGLTICYGDRWFFEKLNEDGKPVLSVLYEKDKLIEKKQYIYKDGYQESCEISLEDRFIKIKYNEKKLETEKTVYYIDGKTELEKNIYTYNEKNLLVEAFQKKDDDEFLSTFEYGPDDKKQSQTDYKNGNKISFIEYKTGKRIIHLFEYGKEVGVLEEEI